MCLHRQADLRDDALRWGGQSLAHLSAEAKAGKGLPALPWAG
jgi:hypothetical protein